MRGKVAKRLRARAEDMSRERPDRVYMTEGATIRLSPGCTRAIYQRLKKEHYGRRERPVLARGLHD